MEVGRNIKTVVEETSNIKDCRAWKITKGDKKIGVVAILKYETYAKEVENPFKVIHYELGISYRAHDFRDTIESIKAISIRDSFIWYYKSVII